MAARVAGQPLTQPIGSEQLQGTLSEFIGSLPLTELTEPNVRWMFLKLAQESSQAMDRKTAYLCLESLREMVKAANPDNKGDAVTSAIDKALKRMEGFDRA